MNKRKLMVATVVLAGALSGSIVRPAFAGDATTCFQCGQDLDGYGNYIHYDYWDGINSYHGGTMHGGIPGTCRNYHAQYNAA